MDDIATCQYAVANLLCGSLVWFTCAGALSDKTQRFLPLSFCPFFFLGLLCRVQMKRSKDISTSFIKLSSLKQLC